MKNDLPFPTCDISEVGKARSFFICHLSLFISHCYNSEVDSTLIAPNEKWEMKNDLPFPTCDILEVGKARSFFICHLSLFISHCYNSEVDSTLIAPNEK